MNMIFQVKSISFSMWSIPEFTLPPTASDHIFFKQFPGLAGWTFGDLLRHNKSHNKNLCPSHPSGTFCHDGRNQPPCSQDVTANGRHAAE